MCYVWSSQHLHNTTQHNPATELNLIIADLAWAGSQAGLHGAAIMPYAGYHDVGQVFPETLQSLHSAPAGPPLS